MKKIFNKDFSMVVIGQIISLFGNNVLRYALPLYLLNQTHSATLYGLVIALSFIPMLVLSPVGGIIADRVNKRNIMVILDFSTAFLIFICAFSFGRVPLVPLFIVVMMLLYGIQGVYQPAVQAAVPVLLSDEYLMQGNSVINAISSLAQIIGPVLGGIVFGFYGLKPVLYISILCFMISAVMEIFIHIPFEKQSTEGGVMTIATHDVKEVSHYIRKNRPEILKVGLLLTFINMFFSALVIVGLPIVVNGYLGFSQSMGNRMYGYAEGALAAGGLIGGILSGIIGNKLKISRSAVIVFLCTLTLLPIGFVLMFHMSGLAAFLIITAFCFIMMLLSTILSIQMITYVQIITPSYLIGKTMALLTCLVMCGHPVGQVIYGTFFDMLSTCPYIIYFGAFLICIVLCVVSQKVFSVLDDNVI